MNYQTAPGANNPALTFFAHFRFTITKQIIFGHTPYGIRHNEYYEGDITGDLVSGRMSGIDYMLYRPDGTDEVNTRATIETHDGAYISVEIKGYALPDGRIIDSYVRFMSGHDNYKWMNDTIFYGEGNAMTDGSYEIYYYYY